MRAWRAETPAPRRLLAWTGSGNDGRQAGLRGNKGVIVAVLCVMAEWVVEPSERSVFRGAVNDGCRLIPREWMGYTVADCKDEGLQKYPYVLVKDRDGALRCLRVAERVPGRAGPSV